MDQIDEFHSGNQQPRERRPDARKVMALDHDENVVDTLTWEGLVYVVTSKRVFRLNSDGTELQLLLFTRYDSEGA